MMKKLIYIFGLNQHRCVQDWEIDFNELERKISNGAILLDVRSIQEYNEGHLNGAIHLADYDIPIKYNIILPDKEREIVVYCEYGGRSRRACKKLKKLGYKAVFSLCGGLDNMG